MKQLTEDRTIRGVAKIVWGRPTSDGAGVALTRIIGQGTLPELDPFLLLDEFRSDTPGDYVAGFPDHPHRGFETVTYMIAGRMRHGDNKGNSGLLGPGSVQWMTAGSGIIHSEMPEQHEGLLWGFQLWVNLPAKDKMIEPRYQDIAAERIPQARFDGGRARVIAGKFRDVAGPVQASQTEPLYLDVTLDPGAAFGTDVPAEHNAFIYVLDGALQIGSEAAADARRGELAVLTPGNGIKVRVHSGGGRFILVAGRPLGEPIARYGPIVMNTKAELQRAFAELQAGTFIEKRAEGGERFRNV